jgi:hypothetical protein
MGTIDVNDIVDLVSSDEDEKEEPRMQISSLQKQISHPKTQNSSPKKQVARKSTAAGSHHAMATKRTTHTSEETPEVKKSKPQNGEEQCVFCHQRLSTVKQRPRDGDGGGLSERYAVNRKEAILDGADPQEKNYFDLKNFAFFCDDNHLVPIEAGIIESGKNLSFSGFISPKHNEDVQIEVNRSGAVTGFWLTGFDPDEEKMIGVTTDLAEYIINIDQAHPSYKPMLEELNEKADLTKLVMSITGKSYSDAMKMDFEDLVEKIGERAAELGMASFTQEDIFRHADFLIEQIRTFEEEADEDEPSILQAPCIKHIIKYSGVSVAQDHDHEIIIETRRNHVRKDSTCKYCIKPQLQDSYRFDGLLIHTTLLLLYGYISIVDAFHTKPVIFDSFLS